MASERDKIIICLKTWMLIKELKSYLFFIGIDYNNSKILRDTILQSSYDFKKTVSPNDFENIF